MQVYAVDAATRDLQHSEDLVVAELLRLGHGAANLADLAMGELCVSDGADERAEAPRFSRVIPRVPVFRQFDPSLARLLPEASNVRVGDRVGHLLAGYDRWDVVECHPCMRLVALSLLRPLAGRPRNGHRLMGRGRAT